MSKSIAVSAQSIELLRAHEVDEEVLAHLNAIHLDPDQAIRILCSTGVGHA